MIKHPYTPFTIPSRGIYRPQAPCAFCGAVEKIARTAKNEDELNNDLTEHQGDQLRQWKRALDEGVKELAITSPHMEESLWNKLLEFSIHSWPNRWKKRMAVTCVARGISWHATHLYNRFSTIYSSTCYRTHYTHTINVDRSLFRRLKQT